MTRAQRLKTMQPHLRARLTLYASNRGGRTKPVGTGWGCPCSIERTVKEAWDGFPLLGDGEMQPGETREVGFVFMSGEEAAGKMRAAGMFYLWEDRLIGEAVVIGP
jgi:hypothetical protein